ncbi:MAG: hypothetical protein JKY01_05575 [Pseudomonadales bacterium]|nr:hypothetical protein [Pseudomonadales bacterium]
MLTESIGDDIRQSEQVVIGSGADNLLFSVLELKEEFESTDQSSSSESSGFITVEIKATNVSEKFTTGSVSGLVSTIIYDVGTDLSINGEFSRSDGLKGSLDVDLVNAVQ